MPSRPLTTPLRALPTTYRTADHNTNLMQRNSYQLYVNNIQSVNAECSNLTPGQSLCLGTSGEDCTTTYIVKPDDTCELITNAAGINGTILSLNNPQIDKECSNIYIGQVRFPLH